MVMLLILAAPRLSRAQDVDEVTLILGYPALGQVYLSAAFRGEAPLLAAGELLNMLYIPYDRNNGGLGMKGAYPSNADRWEIDPVNLQYVHNGQRKMLNANKFFLGETDIFLTTDLFEELFGIELTVNPYALMVSLRSEKPLPIDERRKRQEVRKRLKENAPENILKTFPMMYPRRRSLFAPGMLDYNVGVFGGQGFTQYNYTLNGGMELLGGDIQGSLGGFRSEATNAMNWSNVRWRYVFKGGMDAMGNPLISEISLGQINVSGPQGGRVRGISINNNPVVPRRVLDLFAIEGFTEPDSEIELLIGGQLVDFTRADELGYYRFTSPITYGTIRIGLRIYTPQGEVLMEDRQLQIPFTFVPRGVLTYNLQAGLEERAFQQGVSDDVIAHADMAYGVTNNLTVRAGMNHFTDTSGLPVYTPYGSASMRIFDQYLLNVDYLPNQMARANGSVFYANNTSLNFSYTEFYSQTQLNFLRQLREANVNYFVPLRIFKQASGFRIGAERYWYSDGEEFRYQVDVNTRIGPVITRLNYREEILNNRETEASIKRLATASLTYTVPRTPGLPVFVRGMFFRVQLRHDMKRFDPTALGGLQFSQTVFKTGRLTIAYDRDIVNRGNQLQLGLLWDLKSVRSGTITNLRSQRRNVDVTYGQNLSGSIGMDLRTGTFLPTNRDQVGRAGVTVRMFVDENDNGVYDKGEEIIPAKYVKLDQSATMYLGSDGLLRITQLQSYWTYRLTVDQNALPDASLSPRYTKFSFVADPNRFKMIDIPVYRTGTIEGFVYRSKGGGMLDPQPGLRLIMHREGDAEPLKPIRTFSDGGFYAFGLIPGNYTMVVDSTQLKYMRVVQSPDTLRFTIRAVADGDWIDNLEIRLIPPPEKDTTEPEPPMTLAELEYQLGMRLQATVKAFSEAQELFYRGQYADALAQVDTSLRRFPTDFAVALKGSLAFLLGNRRGAIDLWEEANRRNPFISLPDTGYIRPLVDSLHQNEWFAHRSARVEVDSVEQLTLYLIEQYEDKLGARLRAVVAAFTEAQELFYRRRFEEALEKVEQSLKIYPTDHALALKGSIAYVLGRPMEAWQLWYEARQRNPFIELPDTQILDRMTGVSPGLSTKDGKRLISN
ncbi:MAG: hypothetical protein ACK417_07845 [Bacteroidia bacterium]